MKRNPLAVILVFSLIILSGACQPVPTQIVQESHPINSSSTPTIMKTNSPSSSAEMLPTSMVLGSILTGSGDVDRMKLTFEDFLTGDPTSPLDDGLFSIPESAAMPDVVF